MPQPKPTIVAAHTWGSNADLITQACLPLGYVHASRPTLDPTYGYGSWWTGFRPDDLRAHDLDPDKSPLEPADFRDLPYSSEMFRCIAYDPPYVSVGGRDTSGTGEHLDRYRLVDAPTTPAELQDLMDAGASEMARLLAVWDPKHPSYLLYKAQNYISNGSFWDGIYRVCDHAKKIGLRQVDQFEMVGRTGAQPRRSKCRLCGKAIQQSADGPWFDLGRTDGPSPYCPVDLFTPEGQIHLPDPEATTQAHAARNLSTLMVFVKPKPSKAATALPPPLPL